MLIEVFALQVVIIYTSISGVGAGLYFSIKYREPAWLHNKILGQEKEKEADMIEGSLVTSTPCWAVH